MKQPTTAKELAELLDALPRRRIIVVGDELEDGSDPVEFLSQVLALEDECLNVDESAEFARYIPIVKERVSTKKHEYESTTYLLYWLSGKPYLYAPEPTITYIREGRSLKEHGSDSGPLMISHNCYNYDVIVVQRGCKLHKDKKEETLKVSISRYSK